MPAHGHVCDRLWLWWHAVQCSDAQAQLELLEVVYSADELSLPGCGLGMSETGSLVWQGPRVGLMHGSYLPLLHTASGALWS